jgi:TonB family protein
LLIPRNVDHLVLGRTTTPTIPPRRRFYSAGLFVNVAVIAALLVLLRPHPVRVAPGGVAEVGIAAFDPGPVGTSGSTPKPAPKPAAPRKVSTRPADAAANANQRPAQSDDAGGGSGAQGAGSGSGPVRLGSGEGLTLLNKVTPVYPKMMEAARIQGHVVLEAIIHRDGTIGDVNVLQSTNGQFAQAAVEAVKRWRYSPLPYEGLVTVTVNFTVPR